MLNENLQFSGVFSIENVKKIAFLEWLNSVYSPAPIELFIISKSSFRNMKEEKIL